MSERRRWSRVDSRRRWNRRRRWLCDLRRALHDFTITWDEAYRLKNLALDAVGAQVSAQAFTRECRFWWGVALDGGPRRRALKRLQCMTAFPWPGGKPAEPTRGCV